MRSNTLTGQSVIVTGGGWAKGRQPGFGFGIVQQLALQGANVAVVDRDGDAAQNTVDFLHGRGLTEVRLKAFAADVTKIDALPGLVSQVALELGGLTSVVNNAGVCKETPLLEVTEAEWDMMLDINAKGSFFLAQAALRYMRDEKVPGSLVFVASDAAWKGAMIASAAYTASKGAQVAMMKSFARAGSVLSPVVRAVAICPGPGDTEMTANWPPDRKQALLDGMLSHSLVTPEQIGRAAALVIDPQMACFNGSCVHPNSGSWLV